MLGSVTRQKVCQPLAPSATRRLLLLGALRLHQRDQLAGDEGEGDEDRGQHDAGHGEDDLDVVRAQPRRRTSPARRRAARRSGPEITGETANGRSISVISRLLPRKSNLAMAQAAATPKTRLSGTAMRGGQQRQPDRGERVRARRAPRSRRRRPWRSASAKTAASGRNRNSAEEARAPTPISSQRTSAGSRGGRRAAAGAGVGDGDGMALMLSAPCAAAGVQRCSTLMASSSTNEATSMTTAMAVAPA